jgi:integrase
MARIVGRLTALAVSKTRKKGYYADGGGLLLQVTSNGARSWVYRYMLDGRAREMGLGSLHDVNLGEARKRATECRGLRSAGRDPIEARKGVRDLAKLASVRGMTFAACAEAYVEANKAGWRNEKHAAQWASTLKTYAYPVFGSLPVQSVDTAMVMNVLESIWTTKTETASRVRGRIECVLDWAKTREYREGENPARWRGHIENLLPARSKVRKVEHHPALPFAKVRAFVRALRRQKGTAALAFEFLILTAARTSEVVGARWDEIDLKKVVWTIPANRIKAGREHRVPLSAPALAILKKMKIARDNEAEVDGGASEYVFSGGKKGQPLSNMALLALLKRMKRTDITAHGFRSSFRDWAAEETDHPREVAEMALAHTIGDKVEAAYRRGDLFDKRRALMAEWAEYCEKR